MKSKKFSRRQLREMLEYILRHGDEDIRAVIISELKILAQRDQRKVDDETMNNLWFDPIPPESRQKAVDRIEAGDIMGFLLLASNEDGIDLVCRNFRILKEKGLFEEALLEAYISTRTNLAMYTVGFLNNLFSSADRNKLLELGDPLPSEGPFTIYRGISGRGIRRRVRGISWTASQKKARWFALRFSSIGIGDRPEVWRAEAPRSAVLAYINDRKEQEFIVIPRRLKHVKVWRQCPD